MHSHRRSSPLTRGNHSPLDFQIATGDVARPGLPQSSLGKSGASHPMGLLVAIVFALSPGLPQSSLRKSGAAHQMDLVVQTDWTAGLSNRQRDTVSKVVEMVLIVYAGLACSLIALSPLESLPSLLQVI